MRCTYIRFRRRLSDTSFLKFSDVGGCRMEDEDSVSVELNSYSITLIFRILNDFELLEREADFLILGLGFV